MGQFLEFSKVSAKRKELPKSLVRINRLGFMNASFSPSELRILLKGIGNLISNMRLNDKTFRKYSI